ncbi:flagellar basal body-associated protein FliL [Psychromonas sp. psych-6C06]|uniref:flagellar basal body-associated protein FliL n=1 Tax=Psychromonas sp. psych-6C06 TaxID=2058089 RepID=UPI000C31B9FD|nr:flagellar basal body-associated protein FliL [Psychromonas sp. psych-6C06]PKF63069.1 flagellar basal body-associated protein FliL [Psychromonas sp. psych-6C06]
MWKRALLCVLCLLFNSSFVLADEEATGEGEAVQNDYQYFSLEPDIITNYIKPGKRIGFVRVTVELMVKSKSNYALIDEHEPLIRDKIIAIFGQQNEAMVKSITEREGIRARCLEEVNQLLYTETGKKPLEDVLFTKYLYQ